MVKLCVRAALTLTLLSGPSLAASDLAVVGTGDGMDVLRAIAAAHSADQSSVNVAIPASIGSGGGLAAVGSDKAVLARVARPLSETERRMGLVETPIFRLPSAIFAHRSVGIEGITSQQLAAIYAGKIVNWKDVGGSDQRIKVVRREEDDSTLLVLQASMPGWKNLVFTDKSKMATTTQDAINTVRDVPGAIGYGPYTKNLELELVVLKIDGKYPTDEGYPSAVTVSFVHKASTLTAEAREFIQYARSDKARKLLVSMGGVPADRD